MGLDCIRALLEVDNLSAIARRKSAIEIVIDTLIDELHRAVGHDKLRTAGVHALESADFVPSFFELFDGYANQEEIERNAATCPATVSKERRRMVILRHHTLAHHEGMALTIENPAELERFGIRVAPEEAVAAGVVLAVGACA